MSCQSSVPPVMWSRKIGKVGKPIVFNIGLLCSKSFDDSIFEELFLDQVRPAPSEDMTKMNIKGVFQIWMRDGSYHEINLKECHAWTREGCNHCPDFAAEHADISTGGIGENNDWTLTIVRTDLGREIISRMIADGSIIARPGDEDPGAIALMHKLVGQEPRALARHRRRLPQEPARSPAKQPCVGIGERRGRWTSGRCATLLTVLLGLGTGVLSGCSASAAACISQPGMRLLGPRAAHRDRHRAAGHHPRRGERRRRYVREGLIHWPAVVATVPAGLVAAVARQRRRPSTCPATATCCSSPPPACSASRRSGWPGARARCPPDEPLAETDAPEAPERRARAGCRRRGRARPLRRHRAAGRRPVGPARDRRRRDHGAGLRAARRAWR